MLMCERAAVLEREARVRTPYGLLDRESVAFARVAIVCFCKCRVAAQGGFATLNIRRYWGGWVWALGSAGQPDGGKVG